MMEMMRVLLALLAATAALSAQSVEGSVVNRLTGTPMDGVEVTLSQAGSPAYKTTTDAQGAFRFEGVKPGLYSPHFQKRGYVPNASALRPLQVVEGGQTVSLRGEMMPLGRVSGRVLDADGKPVRGASVQLLSSFGGPSATTGADGSFALEELVPATYTLSARPPKGAKAIVLEDGRRVAWIMTFFPGVAQRSAAARIEVAAGADMQGEDIRLIASQVYRIRGVAVDDKGNPVSGVAIQLSDPTRLTGDIDAEAHSEADGTFEFRDIAEGDWRLVAKASRDELQLRAFQSVQVSNRDQDHYELRLGLPVSVEGTLTMLAPDGSPQPVKNTLVTLAPAVGGSEFVHGRPDESGKFTASGVYPGVYQVIPVPPGAQYYLASIKLGERESTDGRVEFFTSVLPLSVVYRSDGGTVRGTVEECGSATVVLVPRDPALRRREYIKGTKCRANGGYELRAVRPGEYLALALPASDPAFNFMSTDLNQAQLNAGVSVTVRANEATMADLKVTH
jgi:hypothetical protein